MDAFFFLFCLSLLHYHAVVVLFQSLTDNLPRLQIEVSNKISQECLDSFQKLKIRRGYRYIIFKLGEEEVSDRAIYQ
jgi:hypothetical protein